MGQRLERKPTRKPAGPPSVAGIALYLLDRALMATAAAVGIAIFYLLSSVVSGAVAAFPRSPDGAELTPAAQEALLRGLRTAATVFLAGLWLVTVVSIFRFRENDVASYVGGVGGAVCYLALPWLVSASLSHFNASANPASDLLLVWFRGAGKGLLLITLVYLAGKMTLRVVRRPQRAAAAAAVIEPRASREPAEKPAAPRRRSSILRKCWELSMCRDNLRENCPSYKLGLTCWKRGVGCQCDPVLAQRLIQDLERKLRGELPEKERVARERMKEQISYRLTEHGGESFCRECPIYNEHQYYKYRAFYWIAYPITLGLILVARPLIHRGYRWLDVTLARMLDSLAMLPRTDEALRPFIHTVYHFNAEIVFVISAALIIAAYLLDAVDYAVFRAKV